MHMLRVNIFRVLIGRRSQSLVCPGVSHQSCSRTYPNQVRRNTKDLPWLLITHIVLQHFWCNGLLYSTLQTQPYATDATLTQRTL